MPNALLGYPLYITLKTAFCNSLPLIRGLIAFSVNNSGLPKSLSYITLVIEFFAGGVAFVTLKQ